MDQPPTSRRRFRFGLRTLLAVVTFAAIGSWVYWIGWPWWTNLCEQSEFLAAVRQIKAGSPTVPMEKLAPGGNHRSAKAIVKWRFWRTKQVSTAIFGKTRRIVFWSNRRPAESGFVAEALQRAVFPSLRAKSGKVAYCAAETE